MSAWFDRFTKVWATTGLVNDPSDAQANAGFAFIGAAPPTVELFNSLVKWDDQKDGYLFRQIKGVTDFAAITLVETDNLTLLHALQNKFQPILGFTPVQQGGGAGQSTNKVYIGWNAGGLKAQVDSTDQTFFAFLGKAQTWTAVQTFNAQVNANAGVYANLFNASTDIYAARDISAGRNIWAANNVTSNGSINAATDIVASRHLSAGQNVTGNYLYSSGNIYATNQIDAGGAIVSNGGNITALNGKLRATYGSGGDSNAATLLNEFQLLGTSNGYNLIWPNGLRLIICTFGFGGVPSIPPNQWLPFGGTQVVSCPFPWGFPTGCLGVSGSGGPDSGFLEGSEMNVGIQAFDKWGATVLLSRTSGSQTGSETGFITLFAWGY